LKNNKSKKELGFWLKWQSTCLAITKLRVQTPVQPNLKKKKKKEKSNLIDIP
jgi:hypothetical protein